MDLKIRTIIIEDDQDAFDDLKLLIDKNLDTIEIIGHCDTIKASIKMINTLKPEIVFMDIILKDGNAFEILDNIDNSNFEVIFVTAHNQYLEKAIAHYAFHYILKPIELSKLEHVIKRYKTLKERMFSFAKYEVFSKFIKDQFSQLMLHVNNEHIMVNLNDVIKCEADNNYALFFLSNGKKLLASNTLKYYDELLSHKGFFKVHRSCLINVKHISSIYKKEAIILNTKEKIMVSQRNKSNLSDLIKLLS
ncbi:LytR/AlgR family response regulator transcription factor [Aquimarina pacifica]|uniref:LytR/AlgR family response regulator transcription factor n=1 Tax=Aquimarina pacifica TaxID=1296415 RepID=UPI0004716E1E|nr:LytTR family DNA-binding domain-containing protein [Aquimarina pacifica]